MSISAGSSKYLLGIACCCLATLGWSLSGLFVRWVPGLDGWGVNGYRAPATSICLLIYLALRYRADLMQHLWPKQPQALFVVGLFFGVGSTLYVYALTMGTVASVSVLGATSPFFAALLAWLVMRERTSAVSMAATVVALAGVAIVVQAEMTALATGLSAAIISLGTAFCFAGQTVWLRRYRNLEMIPGIALGGLMVFAFVTIFVGLPPLPLRQIGLLALMGLVQLALPLILFAAGAKHVPVVPAMLIALADVVLNPFWVWLVHGEQPPSGTVAGGGLILSAIIGATLFENRRQRIAAEQEG
ncbi:MAG TPA: DMT family transporter [Dongiaceae bacterium]|nr:DMT family transporter [Dongiaceae bacterium]